jgi:hypothetical protein
MAQQIIVTTAPGTTAPAAGAMINENFSEVYAALDGVPAALPEFPLAANNRDWGVTAPATRASNASNGARAVAVLVPMACTVTGVRYRKGTGTTAANVRVALYDATGARVANRTTNFAQGTTASVRRDVDFDAPVAIEAGVYWVYMIGSTTSQDFMGWATGANDYLGPCLQQTESSFASPTTITPPAMDSAPAGVVPFVTLY